MHKNRFKQAAAQKALEWVKNGMVIGLGTGTTADFFIQELSNKIHQEGLKIRAVSSSFTSTLLARKLEIPLLPFDSINELDLYVDGADEADSAKNLLKGRGAAMLREKILAAVSTEFIVIIDDTKLVTRLGQKSPVPVEVFPMACKTVIRHLESLKGKPVLRLDAKKEGPLTTDQENFILDVKFPAGTGLPALDSIINNIPGVLGHGIFVNLATRIIVGEEKGVRIID